MSGCVKSGYTCRIAFETGENPDPSDGIRTVVLKFFGDKTLVSPLKNSQRIRSVQKLKMPTAPDNPRQSMRPVFSATW